MKTIQKEYQLYTFDELDQKAKNRARNDYIESDELTFLSDDMQYKAEELVKQAGIAGEVGKVYYDLSYSQGDGAMFEGDFIFSTETEKVGGQWKKYNITVKHSGSYYHYNSKNIEMEDYNQAVEEEFDKVYVKICKQLASYGYEVIETSQSEENFKDLCRANEWTFLSTGELFNE